MFILFPMALTGGLYNMPEIPIDIGFYESSTLPLAAQNCVNHYPQNPQTKGAISSGALFSTPGAYQVATVGTGPGRGYNVFNDELYIISGNNFYKISNTGGVTNLGTISGSGRVITSNNGVTICIQVPGGSGYFYSGSTGLFEITDPVYQDFQAQAGGVTGLTYKDGYFIFTTAFEFFLSSLVTDNGGRNFNALDFGTAEIKPDKNVRPMTVKNELYIFGTDTIELFQNTGATGFPFQRINGATIDKGLAAIHSLIEFDNSFVFIGGGFGESIAVWRGLSGSATKISTSAIDHALQQYTQAQISDAYAWTYTEDGNFFVGFGLPDTTFVYDATTAAIQGRPVWHERQSNESEWRVNHVIDVYGKNYVLDSVDGRVGVLDRNILKEYGEDITREFTGAYLYNQGSSFTVTAVELKTESGVGNIKGTGSGEDPQVELLMSDNGGRSFFSMGSRSLGGFEDYKARQVWTRVNRVEQTALFRFKTTGETVRNYTNMIARIKGVD